MNQGLKRGIEQIMALILVDAVTTIDIFRNFQGRSIWRNSFLVELHVALLKKGFLIDVSCRNIS